MSTELGLDVSGYQGAVDWHAVVHAGYRYVYVKATEGVTFVDPRAAENFLGAQRVGLRRGLYHFYRPADDPVRQAQWFLQTAGVHPDLPHALDIEVLDGVAPSDVVRGITVWLETVDAAARAPSVIYTSPAFWRSLGDPQTFHQHPLWIAHYGVQEPDVPGGWPAWALWQYTQRGRIAGIDGDVDLCYVQPGPWSGEAV